MKAALGHWLSTTTVSGQAVCRAGVQRDAAQRVAEAHHVAASAISAGRRVNAVDEGGRPPLAVPRAGRLGEGGVEEMPGRRGDQPEGPLRVGSSITGW